MNSKTNGLPIPNILTSISSLPYINMNNLILVTAACKYTYLDPNISIRFLDISSYTFFYINKS